MASAPDPFNLERFVTAQAATFDRALDELRAGRKESHWMWYIFPQMRGLGRSPMSQFYGIASVEEARAYLAHPVLGPRLLEAVEAVLAIEGSSAFDIFGSPDDMKLRSSATLFARAAAPGSAFEKVLSQYFDGGPDPATIELLEKPI